MSGSELLLEQLAGEMMSVYVGDGIRLPRPYVFQHSANAGIAEDEYVVVIVERRPMDGKVKHLNDLFAVAETV